MNNEHIDPCAHSKTEAEVSYIFAVICDHISAQIRPGEGGRDYSWSFSSPCVMT